MEKPFSIVLDVTEGTCAKCGCSAQDHENVEKYWGIRIVCKNYPDKCKIRHDMGFCFVGE